MADADDLELEVDIASDAGSSGDSGASLDIDFGAELDTSTDAAPGGIGSAPEDEGDLTLTLDEDGEERALEAAAPVLPLPSAAPPPELELELEAADPSAPSLEIDAAPALPEPTEVEPPARSPTPALRRPSMPGLDVDALLQDMIPTRPTAAQGGSRALRPSVQSPATSLPTTAQVAVAAAAAAELLGDHSLGHEVEAPHPSTSEFELGAPTEAPPLVVSDEEPAPRPRLKAEDLIPDKTTMAILQKLAGGNVERESAREALIAALSGEPYDAKRLPDPRMMVIGVAKALVDFGHPIESLVDAMLGELE